MSFLPDFMTPGIKKQPTNKAKVNSVPKNIIVITWPKEGGECQLPRKVAMTDDDPPVPNDVQHCPARLYDAPSHVLSVYGDDRPFFMVRASLQI